MQTAFVTGATGIVGSRLVSNLIDIGWHVVVLARSTATMSASSRLHQVLFLLLGDQGWRKVKVVEGDVTRPYCGLAAETISRLKGKCQLFWHCAGDTRFDDRYRDEIQNTNFNGTANALNVAKLLSIENFCHVSTAFIFGNFVGVGQEEPHPDCGQIFNNSYEESKFWAEQLVTTSKLNWIIFRPPIIVGDSKDGSISGFSGYYGFMKEFWRLKEAAADNISKNSNPSGGSEIKMFGEQLHLPIDVPGDESSILTVACVDFVTNAMIALAQLPYCWQQAYHLVPNQSKTFCWWLDTSLKVLNIEGVRMVESNLILDRSKDRYYSLVQRRIAQSCKPYIPYISGKTLFEPINLSNILPSLKHRPIDESFVSILLLYAIEQKFGRDKKSAAASKNVSSKMAFSG